MLYLEKLKLKKPHLTVDVNQVDQLFRLQAIPAYFALFLGKAQLKNTHRQRDRAVNMRVRWVLLYIRQILHIIDSFAKAPFTARYMAAIRLAEEALDDLSPAEHFAYILWIIDEDKWDNCSSVLNWHSGKLLLFYRDDVSKCIQIKSTKVWVIPKEKCNQAQAHGLQCINLVHK